MTYIEALVALADPTRRSIFEAVRRRPCTVGELAKRMRIRQPTASQHLRVLRDAALVRDRREGTRRFYQATPEGLEALRTYLDSLWDDVLAAYATADDPPPRSARTRRRRRT
jgi:DNA-binding transcriptional ArsR family regulator